MNKKFLIYVILGITNLGISSATDSLSITENDRINTLGTNQDYDLIVKDLSNELNSISFMLLEKLDMIDEKNDLYNQTEKLIEILGEVSLNIKEKNKEQLTELMYTIETYRKCCVKGNSQEKNKFSNLNIQQLKDVNNNLKNYIKYLEDNEDINDNQSENLDIYDHNYDYDVYENEDPEVENNYQDEDAIAKSRLKQFAKGDQGSDNDNINYLPEEYYETVNTTNDNSYDK